MRTLKLKAQLTNAFFAVNQMFGGSSQLPTTAERVVIKSLCTVQTMKQCSAVVGNWGIAKHLIDGSVKPFVGSAWNRVRILLKGAVNK